MRKLITLASVAALAGLALTSVATARLPEAEVTKVADPYAYLFERAAPAITADKEGPFAYLFKRDVKAAPAQVEHVADPYAYLFERAQRDIG